METFNLSYQTCFFKFIEIYFPIFLNCNHLRFFIVSQYTRSYVVRLLVSKVAENGFIKSFLYYIVVLVVLISLLIFCAGCKSL